MQLIQYSDMSYSDVVGASSREFHDYYPAFGLLPLSIELQDLLSIMT